MRKILLLAFISIGIISCSSQSSQSKAQGEVNAKFESYKSNFVDALWKLYPGWASGVGYHNYDSVLVIPDEAMRNSELAFAKANLDSLATFSKDQLSDNNKTDYILIENQLHSIEWAVKDLRSYEWDPSEYNVCGSFSEMLNNNYDSLDTRLHNFNLRMQSVPAYYAAAKANIKNPTLEHTQLAIEQNAGGSSVFTSDLNSAIEKSKLSGEEKAQMKERAAIAVSAINDYVAFLKSMKNDHPRSFRLGKELYMQKFKYDIQSGYSVDEIYKKAVEHKKELHGKMYDLAIQLWPKYMGKQPQPSDSLKLIRMVIDRLSLEHVQPDSFQATIEKQIPVLVQFIKDKNLIYLDPSKPLVVRREPDYMAGVAGASISAPGPYDKNGNTYYNVGSLSGWDKERAESYLREYNKYLLQILSIHEAIPGHYTQLIYSNQSPSIIKSILGNGAMVEGWAVYSERMMLENGYGNNEPEMWLMYYKWNLRSTCNTILDISVHSGEMTKEQAMNLLMNEAFQQQTEAENKWRRVSLTSVQLCSYFTGYTEIYDLREEQKKALGDKFDLKKFHEKSLSYGSSPVQYIRQLMMTAK
ncbi:MAG: DUF885 domain-containing protein [Bacteroidia bacterium]